jgi:hypothetical protein
MKFASQKYGDQSGQILHESLFPRPVKNELLQIVRDPQLAETYPEIKDPSVVKDSQGGYLLYASIGNSATQEWIVGRFAASSPSEEWRELPPVEFENISGPQLCAPAVMYQENHGRKEWQMYIQTSCFEENGVIALATSADSQHFVGQTQPVVTHQEIDSAVNEVVGVYDAGTSEVQLDGKPYLCLVFSGYRRVGCGDIFMSLRSLSEEAAAWSPPQQLLAQEEVPFHNQPSDQAFEWGLEGAKIIQLAHNSFLMIGVCFLPLPDGNLGKRQRVFLATSDQITGPYIPLGTPFPPQPYSTQAGEHGHPDSIIIDQDFWLVFQERSGDKQPWHLRLAQFKVAQLQKYAEQICWAAQHFPKIEFSSLQTHDELANKIFSDAQRCVWTDPLPNQGSFLHQVI